MSPATLRPQLRTEEVEMGARPRRPLRRLLSEQQLVGTTRTVSTATTTKAAPPRRRPKARPPRAPIASRASSGDSAEHRPRQRRTTCCISISNTSHIIIIAPKVGMAPAISSIIPLTPICTPIINRERLASVATTHSITHLHSLRHLPRPAVCLISPTPPPTPTPIPITITCPPPLTVSSTPIASAHTLPQWSLASEG